MIFVRSHDPHWLYDRGGGGAAEVEDDEALSEDILEVP